MAESLCMLCDAIAEKASSASVKGLSMYEYFPGRAFDFQFHGFNIDSPSTHEPRNRSQQRLQDERCTAAAGTLFPREFAGLEDWRCGCFALPKKVGSREGRRTNTMQLRCLKDLSVGL